MEEIPYIQRATRQMLLEMATSFSGIVVSHYAGSEAFRSVFTTVFVFASTKLIFSAVHGWWLAQKLLSEMES